MALHTFQGRAGLGHQQQAPGRHRRSGSSDPAHARGQCQGRSEFFNHLLYYQVVIL